jgi:hypothetical protein
MGFFKSTSRTNALENQLAAVSAPGTRLPAPSLHLDNLMTGSGPPQRPKALVQNQAFAATECDLTGAADVVRGRRV